MKAALPPLVPGLPLLGNGLDLLGDPALFLVKNYLRFGPIFRVNAAQHRFVVVAGPEANIFFMKGAGAHCVENRRAFAVMKKELNTQNQISANDGQRHRQVRQLLRPAYSREMLDRNLPNIGEAIECLIRKAPVGQSIPLRLLIQRLIAEGLSRAILGRSSEKIFNELVFYEKNLVDALVGKFAALRVRRPRYRRAKAAIFEFARQIVDEHRHMTVPQGERTITDIILAGRIDGEPLSEGDLIAFTLGPILAGLDTAGSTCAFLICELLLRPELLEQIPPRPMRHSAMARRRLMICATCGHSAARFLRLCGSIRSRRASYAMRRSPSNFRAIVSRRARKFWSPSASPTSSRNFIRIRSDLTSNGTTSYGVKIARTAFFTRMESARIYAWATGRQR